MNTHSLQPHTDGESEPQCWGVSTHLGVVQVQTSDCPRASSHLPLVGMRCPLSWPGIFLSRLAQQERHFVLLSSCSHGEHTPGDRD